MNQDQEPYIPGRYILQALESGFLHEKSAEELKHLLSQNGLTLEDLERPDSRAPVRWFAHLVPKDETTDPLLLALKLGDSVRLTSQGDLSVVLMTSPTIREAMQVSRYIPLQSNAAGLYFIETNQAGYLLIDIHTGNEIVNLLISCYALAALHRLMCINSGTQPNTITNVAAAKPAGFESLPLSDKGAWHFDQPVTCIIIEKSFLDYPSLYADPLAHKTAKRACETALTHHQQSRDLCFLVRRLLEEEHLWEQDAVAERLHMSRSTLKRRLSQLGLTFNELVNGVRKQVAVRRLLASEGSLQGVAEDLGYSDQSNFSHAFKKWFGVAPGEFIRLQQSKP